MWWEGSPSPGSPDPREQQDVIAAAWASSLLLLPRTPTPRAVSPTVPGTRMSSSCMDTIHGSLLTPRDQTVLERLAWPSGKRENPRGGSAGSVLLRKGLPQSQGSCAPTPLG